LYDPVTNPGGWLVYTEPLPEVLTTIVVHHSALPLSDGPREIQQMHFQFKGYADIAYHYLIDETGQIYEGRSLTVRGAHTGGHNTGTVGIVLLGNFEVSQPTETQLASLHTLSACLIDAYAITHIAGHRDFQPGVTDCPGDNLEMLLPTLAAELGIEFGTEGYAGP
jgi:N-acetyl-anhydromuramyl-L-alanine amidase AmpD